MKRKNVIKNIVGGAILVSLILGVRSCFPPSQRSVVRRFERHRGSFEKVVCMLADDPNLWIVAPWGIEDRSRRTHKTPETAGLSQQRYAEYLRLLKKAGAGSVIRDDDQIRFYIDGSGFACYGWRLAIAYREDEPNEVIETLSEFRSDGTGDGANIGYCPIVDNWYIWIIW